MTNNNSPWEAVEVFVNNEPNRVVVKRRGWKGEVIADCGVADETTKANAEKIARALNDSESHHV